MEENYSKKRSLLFKLRIVHHLLFMVHHSVANVAGVDILVTASDRKYDELPVVKQIWTCAYGYGTNWNFMFQTVFLSLSLLYDVLEWLDKHQTEIGKKMMYYRDILFCGMVVPFTLFISSMFWTVYFIDRELVFPTVYDKVVPWWFNHCVHTNISVMLLIETLLQARRNPTDRRLELGLVGGIGVLYAVVYYSIFFITGRWLYAVFGIMTWWQVCLYQLLIWGSTFIFYYLQFPINRIFHREETEKEKGLKEWSVKGRVENSHL